MGFFDNEFAGSATANPFTTPQDAFFAVLYACMTADGIVNDAEVNSLIFLARRKALYRGHDMVDVYRRIAPAVIRYRDRKKAVTLAAARVPAELRAMLFTTCVDFVACDKCVGTAEQAMLAHLQQVLRLDPQECRSIMEQKQALSSVTP